MYLQKVISRIFLNWFFEGVLKSMTKIAGPGSISQRHGSTDQDPDQHQNVMDLEHCSELRDPAKFRRKAGGRTGRQAGRKAGNGTVPGLAM
jgi:hypothetical protein